MYIENTNYRTMSFKDRMILDAIREIGDLKENAEIHGMIADALSDACIIPGFYGYTFIYDAILICIRESNKPIQLCKGVYPKVASKNHSTISSVEHSVRKAVNKSWEMSGPAFKIKYFGAFGMLDNRKPTPKEFIITLSDRIERDYYRKHQNAATQKSGSQR